jgi:hypothetical protein
VESQSTSQHCKESAEKFLEDPEEGPGLHKGQPPQPDHVQETHVRELLCPLHMYISPIPGGGGDAGRMGGGRVRPLFLGGEVCSQSRLAEIMNKSQVANLDCLDTNIAV